VSDKIRDEQLKAIAEKWIEAARMGCVDAFECALKDAWQAALSQHPGPVAVPEGLRERCKELIEWQKTGVLVGDALRSYSKAKWYAEEHNRLQIAEADTDREAYALIAAAPSAPAPAAQEPMAWQFFQDGRWWNGYDNIPDHRANTEAAGIPTRDLYASPPTAEQPKASCQWIPVSERMPEIEQLVLVCSEFGGRSGDWRYSVGALDRSLLNDPIRGPWFVKGASWRPSHWMPLPATPGAIPPAAEHPDIAPVPRELQADDRVPDDFRNQASGYRAGWNDCLAALLGKESV